MRGTAAAHPTHGHPRSAVPTLAAAALSFLVAACAPGPEPGSAAAGELGAQALATSLEVQVRDGRARLRLHATNTAEAPVVLHFTSGQRFDFVVLGAGGEEIWRWSDDQAFTQALGSERIPPGETATWEAVWDPAGRTGSFRARGRIPAREPLEQEATFVVPPTGG